MLLHKPIALNEFAITLKQCVPALPRRIGKTYPVWLAAALSYLQPGVAFSGGSDSLCLLFLLGQLSRSHAVPFTVHAITVDHQLQPESAKHAVRCATLAESLGARHAITAIPWNNWPFPPRPLMNEGFEGLARDCRYRLLFDKMTFQDLSILAMGHHLDDQIETMVMRYSRGTRGLGLAGMRHRRLWGMGSKDPDDKLRWFGLPGMKKHIIRPLLTFPKARILATCEAQNLEFIQDVTNFQPNLTVRNAIRYRISQTQPSIPDDHLAKALDALGEPTLSTLDKSAVDFAPTLSSFHKHQSYLSSKRSDVDQSTDILLQQMRGKSPPSTFLLVIPPEVVDVDLRRAIVLRILRYVSPFPWGSVNAEAGRKSDRLDRLCHTMWDLHAKPPRPQTVGASVLWSPCRYGKDGKIRMRVTTKDARSPDEPNLWLASRLPPIKRTRASATTLDITQMILESSGRAELEVLWDCRFLVKIRLKQLPSGLLHLLEHGLARAFIVPRDRYYQPAVVWQLKGQSQYQWLTNDDASLVPPQYIQIGWIRLLENH